MRAQDREELRRLAEGVDMPGTNLTGTLKQIASKLGELAPMLALFRRGGELLTHLPETDPRRKDPILPEVIEDLEVLLLVIERLDPRIAAVLKTQALQAKPTNPKLNKDQRRAAKSGDQDDWR